MCAAVTRAWRGSARAVVVEGANGGVDGGWAVVMDMTPSLGRAGQQGKGPTAATGREAGRSTDAEAHTQKKAGKKGNAAASAALWGRAHARHRKRRRVEAQRRWRKDFAAKSKTKERRLERNNGVCAVSPLLKRPASLPFLQPHRRERGGRGCRRDSRAAGAVAAVAGKEAAAVRREESGERRPRKVV